MSGVSWAQRKAVPAATSPRRSLANMRRSWDLLFAPFPPGTVSTYFDFGAAGSLSMMYWTAL